MSESGSVGGTRVNAGCVPSKIELSRARRVGSAVAVNSSFTNHRAMSRLAQARFTRVDKAKPAGKPSGAAKKRSRSRPDDEA